MGVGVVRKGCEPCPSSRVAIEDEVGFPMDVNLIAGHELGRHRSWRTKPFGRRRETRPKWQHLPGPATGVRTRHQSESSRNPGPGSSGQDGRG